MSSRNTRTEVIARVAAMFAAIAMSTLTLGSQLGLARHYTSEGDLLLAAKRAAPMAHNAASSAAQRPGQRT